MPMRIRMNKLKIKLGFLRNFCLSVYALALSVFIIRNEKWIAFGSWVGELYSDNSKYLAEYMLSLNKQNDYTLIWVGNTKIRTTRGI